MKKGIGKILRKITTVALALVLFGTTMFQTDASSISEIQNKITEQQEQINQIMEQIGDLEDAQDLLEEEISDLDAELLNTMTAIGLLEDEITLKEADIQTAQALYEEAKELEEQQYQDMKLRIQMMYENSSSSYLEAFFSAQDFGDLLNQLDYMEALYEYNDKMLQEYKTQKQLVADLWAQLEEDKASLEVDKLDMEDQKVYLDGLIERKKKDSANFEAQIAKANQEAAAYKKKIQQEKAQIAKLEEEEKRKAAAAAVANGTYTVTKFDTSVIDNATGSDLGKKIAKYGCQYIGNPYVMGGTSLTKGADCSGFIYRIYSDFGYSIPRTSYQQRSAGTAVAYENAQPGDIICYDGHVGLYVGGGYIVHASSAKTGIKISKATYRTILSVRRII